MAATGPLTFCEGRNVLLRATVGTGYTYQWKKNGVNIPAQTQSNFTATATGVYTVLVTNAQGCTTLSSAFNITVTPAPAAIVTANGPLTFPQGGSVILNVPSAAGNTYQWKKDGVNITGATTASYTATASGSYSVAVTNAGGCQATSQPAVVTVTQSRPITKGLQEEENITVYPNPLYRNNYLNIDWNIAGDNAVSVTVYVSPPANARALISSNVVSGFPVRLSVSKIVHTASSSVDSRQDGDGEGVVAQRLDVGLLHVVQKRPHTVRWSSSPRARTTRSIQRIESPVTAPARAASLER